MTGRSRVSNTEEPSALEHQGKEETKQTEETGLAMGRGGGKREREEEKGGGKQGRCSWMEEDQTSG